MTEKPTKMPKNTQNKSIITKNNVWNDKKYDLIWTKLSKMTPNSTKNDSKIIKVFSFVSFFQHQLSTALCFPLFLQLTAFYSSLDGWQSCSGWLTSSRWQTLRVAAENAAQRFCHRAMGGVVAQSAQTVTTLAEDQWENVTRKAETMTFYLEILASLSWPFLCQFFVNRIVIV